MASGTFAHTHTHTKQKNTQNEAMKHSHLGELSNVAIPGLCFTGARVPQATSFCLWATGKTYFFHISSNAGHSGFRG